MANIESLHGSDKLREAYPLEEIEQDNVSVAQELATHKTYYVTQKNAT